MKRLANIADTISKSLEENKKLPSDFSVIKKNALNAYIDMKAAIKDINYFADNQDNTLVMLDNLIGSIEPIILNVETPEGLKSNIEIFVNTLNNFDYERYELWDLSWTRRKHCNVESYNNSFMRGLSNSLKNINRDITILDLTPNNGVNETTLFVYRQSQYTYNIYAVDRDKSIPKSVKDNLTRTIYGDLKGSNISNEAFDVVMCSPKYTFERVMENNVYVKEEREMLKKALNYLRFGGFLIYTIPVTHLYSEICSILGRGITDIDIRVDDNRFVYITGYKVHPLKRDEKNREEIESTLKNLMLEYMLPKYNISNEYKEITLPDNILEIKTFRGSELDEDEFNEMYEMSNSTLEFWRKHKALRNVEEKYPLLPFSVGQIGLILTSGCLDGVIDEGDGFCHAVKGRVIKVEESNTEYNAKDLMATTTTINSNRVQINMFLPDGTYKSLV